MAHPEDNPGTGASVAVAPTNLGTVARADLLENQWRLVKLLGQGAVGQVWQAQDVTLDRPVAVKLMHEAVAKDAAQVARFEREARVLASLEHPNLLPVLGMGRQGARPFLVTRLLEGKTLAEAMHRSGGRLSPPQTARVLGAICDALEYLHAAQIVHRDLKPSNIFISDDKRVTLMDLGSALELGSERTRTGQLLGAPGYLSPEQIGGSRQLDGKSDVYGLGCLLYEVLTGAPAFTGEPQAVIAAHLSAPRPDAAARGAPQALAELARHAMAVTPGERPTALEFKAGLERFLPNEETTTPVGAPLLVLPQPDDAPTQGVVFSPTTGTAAYPDDRPPALAPNTREGPSPAGDATVPRGVPLSLLITGSPPRESMTRKPSLSLDSTPRVAPARSQWAIAAPQSKPLTTGAKALIVGGPLVILAAVVVLMSEKPEAVAEPVRVDQPAVAAPVKKDEAKVSAESKGFEQPKEGRVVALPNLQGRKDERVPHERSAPDARSRKPNRTPVGFGKIRVITTLDGNVVPVLLYVENVNKAGEVISRELKGRTPLELELTEGERHFRVDYEDDPPIRFSYPPLPRKYWDRKGMLLEIAVRELPPAGVGPGGRSVPAVSAVPSGPSVSPMQTRFRGARQ